MIASSKTGSFLLHLVCARQTKPISPVFLFFLYTALSKFVDTLRGATTVSLSTPWAGGSGSPGSGQGTSTRGTVVL